MATVNIICRDSDFGLARCQRILAAVAARAGHTVTLSRPERDRSVPQYLRNLYRALASRLQPPSNPDYDINIFIEDLDPGWFSKARQNDLIPNQEWFHYRWLPYLFGIDRVLAKTRRAQTIFATLGCPTNFISFTSEDRFDPSQPKDYSRFFHLAGNSPYKGTDTLLKLWQQHPEWPQLVVIQSAKQAKPLSAANICYQVGHIDDHQLQVEQNRCGIHLCLSETEGFGHYIVEAMSCQALVVTTDAAPMNELITEERGLLVAVAQSQRQGLDQRHFVDSHALETCIQTIIAMDDAQKQTLGTQAREWYLANQRRFETRLQWALGQPISQIEERRAFLPMQNV
ncbi:MAG: glycosyltransferase family 4 protein [Leptolyngbya sp. RL_3_1]|nr:glycosyltransferase family 4 protein [Leptolyngbya sp. RL_3_1]